MKFGRMAQLLLGVCVGAFCFVGKAHADQWAFATGLNYTSGDYDEAVDTTVYTVPFSASYRADTWSFSVTVPYVWLEGSGNIIPGAVSGFGPGGGAVGGSVGGSAGASVGAGGTGISVGSGLVNVILPGTPTTPAPPPPPGPVPVVIEEEGLGDVTMSASFSPFQTGFARQFSFGADVRLPTGDEDRALGAGEVIGGLSTLFVQPVGDQTAFYAAVGYQHAFESDVGGTSAALGLESLVSGNFLLGASVDWADATVDGAPSQSNATLYAGVDLTDSVRLSAFALTGLSETSPDVGAGVRLIFRP